jgi:hypothetical protein
MLDKFAKRWKFMTGGLACLLVVPYVRSWSWCHPIFRASLMAGRKRPEKTLKLLGMLDKVTGWVTHGFFTRHLAKTGIEVVSAFTRTDSMGAKKDEAGSELCEGHCVGGDGFYAGTMLKPLNN